MYFYCCSHFGYYFLLLDSFIYKKIKRIKEKGKDILMGRGFESHLQEIVVGSERQSIEFWVIRGKLLINTIIDIV